MEDSKEGKIYSPHYGIYPFDPEAKPKPKPKEPELTEKELEKHAIDEDLDGNRVYLDPEVPYNHKWFKGEFHTAPWGADSSPFAGRPDARVRVSMIGKKLSPTTRNGIASVYGVITAVFNPEDRRFIGNYGWWKLGDFSHSSPKRTGRRGKA